MSHIVSGPGVHRAPEVHHHRHLPSFWRHFLQMPVAMAVGMLATGAIFLPVVGIKTWDQVTVQYPTQALLAMAAGTTIPMVAWMLLRGMGARDASEMAAAMVLPVVPFLCLVWVHVTKKRAVRAVLRADDRGDARAHVLPPQPVLGAPCPRTRLHAATGTGTPNAVTALGGAAHAGAWI